MILERKPDGILEKENNSQIVLSLIQFFKTFLTPKNICTIGEHLHKILERIICQTILSLIQFFEWVFEHQKHMSFWWKFVIRSLEGQ